MAGTNRRLFRAEEAFAFWSSKEIARKALSRLVKDGWLERIERGLYLIVPLEAGLDGHWSEDSMVIASQLAPNGAVGYWTALHHWGMTEQIPRTVFVQTPKRKSRSRLTVLGVGYKFVFVTGRKFFGVAKQWSDGIEYRITDREKTLVDALDRPDLCGGLPVLAGSFGNAGDLDWDRFDSYLKRFSSGAVYKRLGYMVERLEVPLPEAPRRLTVWRRRMTTGVAFLDPRGPQKGPINNRWRVRVNVSTLERKR